MGHLFFYGTLLPEHRGYLSSVLSPILGPGRKAFVRGRLLGIGSSEGWYPGLVKGDDLVEGQLYRCGKDFGRETLAMLDAYEGFDPRRSRRSEYLRRTIPVTIASGGTALAQLYFWNRHPRTAAVEIASGSFARFIAETGLPVFGAA